jgi:hypothetical protein
MEPRLSSEASLCEERPWTPEREAVLAALNGVLGDYLVATDNPLAIHMSLRRNGRALVLESPLAAVSRKRRLCKLLCLLIIAKEGIRVATTQGFACPKGGIL